MTTTTYSLEAKFNGTTIRKRTKDISETIKALKPDWLHTDMYLTVKNSKKTAERYLTLKNAKRVFNDDVTREVFINNLLLT